MSDVLISSLQEQITRLNQENATLRAEAKDRRLKGKAARDEVDTLKAQLESLTTERDKFKAINEAKPGELQAEVDKLKGTLRERDHRDKFRTLAKSEGVNEKALDDLWTVSGYKAESDEIDESKIKAAIGQALQGRDYLKAATGADASNGTAAGSAQQGSQKGNQATQQAGPGANRGVASGSGSQDAILAERYPNAFRIA